MLNPHHLTPPPPEIYPLYLGYWLPLAITKAPTFPSFLGKSSRDYTPKISPSREIGNTHAALLCAKIFACVCVKNGALRSQEI